jgi:hypothetical protein
MIDNGNDSWALRRQAFDIRAVNPHMTRSNPFSRPAGDDRYRALDRRGQLNLRFRTERGETSRHDHDLRSNESAEQAAAANGDPMRFWGARWAALREGLRHVASGKT